nr:MAG TPA: HNH endonuclease bacteriophage, HNH Endonuclease, DNA.52A [Caudoviricetes sp.]
MASFDYSRANKRWRRLRLQALRRDGFRCREAARYGRAVDAEVVHHIWPAEEWPEYAYQLWNLVSLSAAAHDAMHDRATRKLTPLGQRWKNATPPPRSASPAWGLQLVGPGCAHAAKNFPPPIPPESTSRPRDADATHGHDHGGDAHGAQGG